MNYLFVVSQLSFFWFVLVIIIKKHDDNA